MTISAIPSEDPAMRMPRFRFTVRRMMVVLAVLAVALGTAGELLRRRDRFKQLARYHNEGVGVVFSGPIEEVRRIKAHAEWHAGLREKYQHAARHPWLPVAPDPPEPE